MTLYDTLNKLVENNENFNKSIQEYGEYKIISFTYRLPSYSDFLLDGALECRGTTFVEERGGKISLIGRPFAKFFNYKENPFTEESVIDKLIPIHVMDKADGSLIIVCRLPNGELIAKTKSTILSEQAQRATEIVNSDKFKSFCGYWIDRGHTPIFEYVSPENRIVLFYPEEKLILLALRNMETGEYHDISNLACDFDVIEHYDIKDVKQIERLQESSTDNEGWVVIFNNGLRAKFKTFDYLRKHRVKDSITNPKHLADLILHDGLDDILPLISEDTNILNYVNNFKEKIKNIYNSIEEKINLFYNDNRNLDRKDFAIKSREEHPEIMSLIMSKYLNRDPYINEFIIKNELYKNL
jgi:T4 RnlA family RNA ligase